MHIVEPPSSACRRSRSTTSSGLFDQADGVYVVGGDGCADVGDGDFGHGALANTEVVERDGDALPLIGGDGAAADVLGVAEQDGADDLVPIVEEGDAELLVAGPAAVDVELEPAVAGGLEGVVTAEGEAALGLLLDEDGLLALTRIVLVVELDAAVPRPVLPAVLQAVGVDGVGVALNPRGLLASLGYGPGP